MKPGGEQNREILSEEKENWDISITRLADLVVTLSVFAAFCTELEAVKAKPPTATSSDCICTVYS